MGIFSWIIIGLLAGWLAAKITESPHGLLRNLLVGLVGSIVARRLRAESGSGGRRSVDPAPASIQGEMQGEMQGETQGEMQGGLANVVR